MITKRQQLFVKEYLVDMNASAAARRAGYSVKNADKIGSQLLGKTRVAEQIRIATEARTNKLDIKADVVLQELAKIAFANIGDFIKVNENNEINLKGLSELNPSNMSAIKSISLGSNGLNIQFYDKISALKSLGDHLNLWNSKVNDEKSERDQARINAIERVKKFLEKRTTRTMPSTEV